MAIVIFIFVEFVQTWAELKLGLLSQNRQSIFLQLQTFLPTPYEIACFF